MNIAKPKAIRFKQTEDSCSLPAAGSGILESVTKLYIAAGAWYATHYALDQPGVLGNVFTICICSSRLLITAFPLGRSAVNYRMTDY